MANILFRFRRTWFNSRGIVRFGVLLLGLCLPVKSSAHICGPSVMIARPGDLFYYYILSDVIETSPSSYQLLSVNNSAVADVSPATPFSAFFYGEFGIEAKQSGQTDASFYWAYAPFNASGTCNVHIVITNNVTLAAANYPQSALSGDPVNAFTGALVNNEPPDLDLGGPMPLQFRRIYDSTLSGSLLIRSTLGINWAHNFDSRIIRVGNRVDLVTFQGARAQFLKTNNVWQAINSAGKSYQLIESVNGTTTNLMFGDRRSNLIMTFDTFGQLTSIADGKGNVHSLTYSNNALIKVSDGLGRTLNFQNGGFQVLQTVSDGARTIQFSYSPDESVPQLLTVTDAMAGVTTYTYDSATGIPALLASRTLPRGNTPYIQSYDSIGRVIQQVELGVRTNKFVYGSGTTSITNPLGMARTYTHNTNGQLIAYSDETSQSVAITVSTNGQRSVITDRSGNKTGFAYDSTSGKVSAITNSDGSVTGFAYTSYVVSGITFYALSSVTYPDASTENYTYDSVGNVLTRADRQGNVSTYTYNGHGQPLTIRNPRGGMTFLTYNSDGTLASTRNSDVGTTMYVYDSLRRLMRVNHPDSSSTVSQLDNNDRVTLVTDERGNTYHYYYDANGNVTNIVDPNSASSKYTYDGMDRAVGETDRLGHNQSVAYNAMDHLASFTDRNNLTTTIGYDVRGRMNAVTNPAGGVWKLGVTAEGNGNSITNPLNQAFTRHIDASGYVTAYTNPLHNASSLVRNSMHQVTDYMDELKNTSHFTYSLGWLTDETRPRIGSVSFARNSLGLVEQYTDFNSHKWSYGYTDMGRPKSFTDPLMWATLYNYNSRGWNTGATFADGVTRSSDYDVSGNLTHIHYSDGTDLNYGYDNLNRAVSGKWITLGLDAEGRPTNSTSWGVNFGATYDPSGRVTSATYNNGAFKVDYYYDNLNRLMLASNGVYGAWVRLGYDSANHLTGITRANGVNATYTRDLAGGIARIQDGPSIDLQYTLNPRGFASQINYTAPLDPAKFTLPASMSFSYNAGSQISNPGFGYDWQGRMTSGGGHTYQWNGVSQLVNADGVSFGYDGWNQMMSRSDATTSTRYYYNQAMGDNRIAGEYNVNTSQYTRYYVWAPHGALLFSINPLDSSVSYPHYGRDGSTLALTDGLGKITDAYAYGISGTMLSHTGAISQPYTYLGALGVRYDYTANIYQMGGRYYNPSFSSFLSPDTSWPHLDNPQSTPYSFANNDSVDYFNTRGFDAQPLRKDFFGHTILDENPHIPIRAMFPVQEPGRISINSFLRNDDPAQSIGGTQVIGGLRDSPFSGFSLGGFGEEDDCCCYDCCCDCCDCCDCCCDCCCDDCCDDGPGPFSFGGFSLTAYTHGGIYSPLQRTSFAVAFTEAYRKFQMVRVVPRASVYMPIGEPLPGLLSPARALRATDDFREDRNFRNFDFYQGVRSQF